MYDINLKKEASLLLTDDARVLLVVPVLIYSLRSCYNSREWKRIYVGLVLVFSSDTE